VFIPESYLVYGKLIETTQTCYRTMPPPLGRWGVVQRGTMGEVEVVLQVVYLSCVTADL
jgi:hypothetical protein